MKRNILMRYTIFIIICIINTSCCHKNDINDDMNKNILKKIKTYSNKYILDEKKINEKIKILKNTNIIYFHFDQYHILPYFTDILNQHADFLKKNQHYKILIEGHADERGTPEYNIALGERRANSVKIYLQTQGITENQISLISYGKEKLAFSGHTEKDHERNRRAILIY